VVSSAVSGQKRKRDDSDMTGSASTGGSSSKIAKAEASSDTKSNSSSDRTQVDLVVHARYVLPVEPSVVLEHHSLVVDQV
jgi:hypothetical protein